MSSTRNRPRSNEIASSEKGQGVTGVLADHDIVLEMGMICTVFLASLHSQFRPYGLLLALASVVCSCGRVECVPQ